MSDGIVNPRRDADESRLQTTARLSLFVWVAILVLNGTYLRGRGSVAITGVDWLVIARLGVAAAGALLGMHLISTQVVRLGTGARIVITFIVMALFTALFSKYFREATGYWLLLAGAGLVTVGVVGCQTSVRGLARVETLFFMVLCICVLKDGALSFFSPELQEDTAFVSGYERLGVGLIPPNRLGFTASLAFWMSFKFRDRRGIALLWFVRLLLATIVLLTRSRTSIMALVFGGLVWLWMEQGFFRPRGFVIRYGLICAGVTAACAVLLLASNRFGPLMSLMDSFNRGEDTARVMTLTGRTEIWAAALRSVAADPVTLVIGHGYGTSELVLREMLGTLSFIPRHTHNTILEFLVTMGVPGVILFIIIVLYAMRWYRVFQRSVPGSARHGLAGSAVVVLAMILLSSMTETYIAKKVNFTLMALLTYLTILGQVEVTADDAPVPRNPIR